MNAQGEDVVAGIRTPVPILELQKVMPNVYDQLREITTRLEKHYKDMQDFEFTIQEGKLYMLQTRNGKRTGPAAVRVAIQMVDEGLISKEDAIFRVDPNQLYEFLLPRLDEKKAKVEVLATGLPASPGAAVGQIVFTADEAVEKAGHGATKNPVILVRAETTPEDIHGMEVAAGILTSRGGMTSHAAVVTRGMGKCCVAGAGDIEVDEKAREMRVKGQVFKGGDWISLDGTTGRVIKGKLGTMAAKPDDPELMKLMSWAEPFRKLGVRANADIPRDAIQARAFGAEGIGLCRTEHMFFGEKKLPHMRAMILANTEKDRRAALKKLLPLQRADFVGVFRAMDGFPVTIRTLDPPLHEFLPRREDLMVEIAVLEATKPKSPKLKGLKTLLRRVEELHEFNPMLGHRGCRLGITYPEITEMQARAIFEAAVTVAKDGVKVFPEVMIPLTATLKEMANQAAIVHRVAQEVFKEKEKKVDYLVGTMIELPRAALVADEIAKEAQFFSFGTNDLTQTTFGFSRDDINKVLPTYLEEGILKQDPFAVLDQEGVGQLVRMATERGQEDTPRSESRHLRRARRRTVVGRVLPPGRTELCVLLPLPRSDRASGGSASCSRRQVEGRRRPNEIMARARGERGGNRQFEASSVYSASSVVCCPTGSLLHFLQAGNQLLREVLFRLRPQQPGIGAGILFHLAGKFHQLLHVGAHSRPGLDGQGNVFLQKRGVQAKVHLDVAFLLLDPIVKFQAVDQKLHRRGLQRPLSIFGHHPQVPKGFKQVSVVFMQQVGGDEHRLLGGNSRRKSPFEDGWFIPRDRVKGQIGDPGPRHRKRKLAHHGEGVRQHVVHFKGRKPKTQIERIRHARFVDNGLSSIVNRPPQSRRLTKTISRSDRAPGESNAEFGNSSVRGACVRLCPQEIGSTIAEAWPNTVPFCRKLPLTVVF